MGENVFGIINWSKGLVFEQVCADLENAGYEVQPFIIPTAGLGALHRRDRVWFVAYSSRIGFSEIAIQRRTVAQIEIRPKPEMPSLEDVISYDFRTESNKYGVIDGIPVGLDECSIHGYGNAVVPQVVFQIFQTIDEYERAVPDGGIK